MGQYIAGRSRLRLKGHAEPVEPGQAFVHDFGPKGPEGIHGPAREAALLASGAITKADEAAPATSATITIPAADPDADEQKE
jgi:hypothetical protein